jgi:hypothetical protein
LIPRFVRREAYSLTFSDLCVARWHEFVSRAESTVHTLEGVAFQSTVRFMYAAHRTTSEIQAYVDRFVEVTAPAAPLFVFLRPRDLAMYLSEFVCSVRGPAWVEKVSSYVASTPIARRHGWTGKDGLIAFWSGYGELCAELVAAIPFRTLQLAVEEGQHEAACLQAQKWVVDHVLNAAESAPHAP